MRAKTHAPWMAARNGGSEIVTSDKHAARVAGLLYLLVAISGAFSIVYFPSAFVVPGNATATASKIAASEQLYRICVVSDLVAQIAFVFLVVALYQLLKAVSEKLAFLMMVLALASVPMSFAIMLSQMAPLILLGGADFVSVFEKHQLDALAMFFLNLRTHGTFAISAFWGLWLFPFGILVFKSGFLPRVLGVLLIVAGLAYLTSSLMLLLFPSYGRAVSLLMLIPEAVGELSIIFWLLIKGVSAQPLESLASRGNGV
jgi:uncharacterized protein DUF4386